MIFNNFYGIDYFDFYIKRIFYKFGWIGFFIDGEIYRFFWEGGGKIMNIFYYVIFY